MTHYTAPTLCPQCGQRHISGMRLTYQDQELIISQEGNWRYSEGYMEAQCANCGYKTILTKP